MKKFWSMFLVLSMLVALPLAVQGEAQLRGYEKALGYQYVALGTYNQGENGEVAPVIWRVLEVADGQAYLLSEYILGNNRVHGFDDDYIAFGAAWNQTELYQLFNGPYDEALYAQLDILQPGEATWAEPLIDQLFTEEELTQIAHSDELGYLFLVESDDLNNKAYGLGSSKTRKAFGTPYALANGLYKYSNGSSPYWTRTQSTAKPFGVRCTKIDGAIGYIRCVVMNEGLRPALYLKLDDLTIASGDGSLAAPLTFAWQ